MKTTKNDMLNKLAALLTAVALASSLASCAGPGYVSASVGVTDADWGYYDDPWFDAYYAGYRSYGTYGYGDYDYYGDADVVAYGEVDIL